MNRGIFTGLMLLASAPLYAHVSTAEGSAHASEHLWLLLLVAPALLLLRPLIARQQPINKD